MFSDSVRKGFHVFLRLPGAIFYDVPFSTSFRCCNTPSNECWQREADANEMRQTFIALVAHVITASSGLRGRFDLLARSEELRCRRDPTSRLTFQWHRVWLLLCPRLIVSVRSRRSFQVRTADIPVPCRSVHGAERDFKKWKNTRRYAEPRSDPTPSLVIGANE
uniref:Uncharacterized protein n=1 Tax=Sipha flava TaxID=143950 RepID=A0A2S2R721_9HEMI